MDTKEYIESGIIESYVLGSVSDQERREVECMSAIYPELKKHLEETQHSFEAFAKTLSMEAPPQVKTSILAAIKTVKQETKTTADNPETKIVSLTANNTNKTKRTWLAAASILLLIGLGTMFILEANNNSKLQGELASLKNSKEAEIQKNKNLLANLSEKEKAEKLILAANTIPVQLAGTALSPDANVKVYYNAKKGQAFLSTPQLPSPEKNKQYQLWALVDGKAIDLGVFDYDSTTNFGTLLSVDLVGIQSFAITLEKKGGSPTPNLEQLYVIGNI